MTRPLFHKPKTSGTAEFLLRQPENLLLVKREKDGGVLICATADNLTAAQQEAFFHYLCVEGFVSMVSEPRDGFHACIRDWKEQPVRWIVDPSWPEVDPVYAGHLQRLCWYTAGTMVVWVAVVLAMVCR